MGGFVALLRGINVGGRRKVPMAELRDIADDLGLADPRTYAASGNLFFEANDGGSTLERKLEKAIGERFGFDVDVIVRSTGQWAAYCAGNPLREESGKHPDRVMLMLGKRAVADADVAALRAKASPDERVERAGDVIWIWFGTGAGRSKIGVGSTGKEVWTMRNWRTVAILAGMLGV